MDPSLRELLIRNDTDIEGVVNRLSGDDELLTCCLKEFLSDKTITELDIALKSLSWDDAFTAAHALKGMAGNMGFIPLFYSTAELVILIREGRTREIPAAYNILLMNYRRLASDLRRYFQSEIRQEETV